MWVIGGIGNLAYQGFTGNINSLGDGFAAFGIGAVAGAAAGFTGGATLAATGTGTTLVGAIGAGAASGAVGGATAGLIQGTGNSLYFGNNSFGEALGDGLTGAAYGAAFGAVTGGIIGGVGYKPGGVPGGPPNQAVGPGGRARVANDAFIKASIKTGNPIAQLPDGTIMQQLNNGNWVKYNPGVVSNTGAQAGLPNGVGGLNLFKFGSPQPTTSSGWRIGDRFLNLPNRGSPQLNWKQNA